MWLKEQSNGDPSPYVQSIVMFMLLTLYTYIAYLTAEFVLYLLLTIIRCLRKRKAPKLGTQKLWARILSVLLLLGCLAAAIFLFADSDVQEGIDDGVEAIQNTQSMYSELQSSGRLLETESEALIGALEKLEEDAAESGHPLPGEQETNLEIGIFGLGEVREKSGVFNSGMEDLPLEAPEEEIDTGKEIRTLSLIAGGLFFAVAGLVILAGSCRVVGKWKFALILMDLGIVACLITAAVAAALSFSASVAIADWCQAPADNTVYIAGQYIQDRPETMAVIEYYVRCGEKNDDGDDDDFPFQEELDDVETILDGIRVNLADLQEHIHGLGVPELTAQMDGIMARLYGGDDDDDTDENDNDDDNDGLGGGRLSVLHPMAAAETEGLLGEIRELQTRVECSVPFQELRTFQAAACDPLIRGLVSISVVCGVFAGIGLLLRCMTTNQFDCGCRKIETDDDDDDGVGRGGALDGFTDAGDDGYLRQNRRRGREEGREALLRNEYGSNPDTHVVHWARTQ